MSNTKNTTSSPHHVRIRSRDTPLDQDPFRFLFPKPRPHPVLLDHLGHPIHPPVAPKRSASHSDVDDDPAKKRPKIDSATRPSSADTGTLRNPLSRSSSPGDSLPPPGPLIIQSLNVVKDNIKAYTSWFIDPDEHPDSPSSSSVELVYLTKTYREVFSLLRPKPLVQALSNALTASSSINNMSTLMHQGSRTNTPSPTLPVNTRKAYISAHDPNCEYDPVFDLIETVRMLVRYSLIYPPDSIMALFSDDSAIGVPPSDSTPPPQGGILRRLDRARNRRSLPEFVSAVNEFNRHFTQCKRDGFVLGYTKRRNLNGDPGLLAAINAKMSEYAPAELVHHLLYQSYSRAVAPLADVLRKYDAFSNTVYGEVNPMFVDLIIDKLQIAPKHTFIDLGSGIGNVVLHVAARTECTAYGVEIQPAAADLAQKQLEEFRGRLKYVNRRLGLVELYEGDMLTHPKIPKIISRAHYIFCNNYVFQPELNRALLELFLDLQDGTKLVSLREFSPVDNKVTLRNYQSLEALFEVEGCTYPADFVSWTDQPGRFYVHTMNRARVRAFCEANGLPHT